jgi:hypothetical protein
MLASVFTESFTSFCLIKFFKNLHVLFVFCSLRNLFARVDGSLHLAQVTCYAIKIELSTMLLVAPNMFFLTFLFFCRI